MIRTRLGGVGGVLPVLCLLLPLLSAPRAVAAPAAMQGYCNVPPFPSASISANLLLMLDNSASMFDLAYQDRNSYCSSNDAVCSSDADCGTGSCNPSYCVDGSYRDGTSYVGYFDRSQAYAYDFASGSFVPGASLPTSSCGSGSCAASTGYLYVEMNDAVPPAVTRSVRSFLASGNFLNWLATSKMDLEKQVLTGGKYLPLSGVLQGESRGCQGGRFVKMLPGVALSFAVRGPLTTIANYPLQVSYGGATGIELYDRGYNRPACLSAVGSWVKGDREGMIANADLCQGVSENVAPPDQRAIFNRTMADCGFFLAGSTFSDITLWLECKSFAESYPTHPYSVSGICAKNVSHKPRKTGRSSYDTSGFLGKCTESVTDPFADQNLGSCVGSETGDFCNQMTVPPLTDPSAGAYQGSSTNNVPDFLGQAGVASLGAPAALLNAAVRPASTPTGLIQQFSGSINFGAMAFNYDGAAAECAAGTLPCPRHCGGNPAAPCSSDLDCGSASCSVDAELDGGRIVSYLNDPATPVGDHGSGLIQALDGVGPAGWSPFAEAFYSAIGYFAHRGDLRLNATDFDLNRPDPSPYGCQRNHILIVGDGMSSADGNAAMESLAKLYSPSSGGKTGYDSANKCPPYQGSRSLDDLAWLAHDRNIRSLSTRAPASGDLPAAPAQSITTHVVFTGAATGGAGECDPATLFQDTAASGGGSYSAAATPQALYSALHDALARVAGSNTGGDASFLAAGDGNGAVFLQQQFSPLKSFDGGVTSAAWTGELTSLWYYIDPFLGASPGSGSSVREDSDGDLMLTLDKDRVVQFLGNSASSRLSGSNQAYLFYDANADGIEDAPGQTVSGDALHTLWRAGISLWQRQPGDRTIYTELDGVSLANFAALINPAATDPRSLQALQAADAAEAQGIVSYVAGNDAAQPGYRSRLLAIAAGSIPGVAAGAQVWKLGDIVSSTPKVQSSAPLNSFHLAPPAGYGDANYRSFVRSSNYQKEAMVYVGANDGMLHAVKLGTVSTGGMGPVKAKLAGADLGKEQWAFVPKHALPYLTYLKEPGYRHLYFVDGAVTLLDASIGDTGIGDCVKASYWKCAKRRGDAVVRSDNSLDPARNTWRSVLIGGMGLGGGSCASGSAAQIDAATASALACVPAPVANPYQNAGDASPVLGNSSYFALDVTDPVAPQLLWEFSNPELGYATSGPALVRIGDPEHNGRWFAVFGSGPTGPLSNGQFLGRYPANQRLKFFVVDLRSGALVATLATEITGFAGSLVGGGIDTGKRSGSYQDDAIYVGYTQTGDGSFNDGGVLRILTGESDDPSRWQVSKVIDGIGPVTAGVAKLQDYGSNRLWLYFGTGRYFYGQDDMTGRRSLFGIAEPCYNQGLGWRSAVASGSLVNQSDPSALKVKLDPGDAGWRIDLDPDGSGYGAERCTVAPTTVTSGAVFFTTFQPSTAPCSLDASYLWGVKYDSGNAVTAVNGTALLPLSNAGLAGSSLPGSLTDRGNRRSAASSGRATGLKLISNSGLKPLKKIIHIQER